MVLNFCFEVSSSHNKLYLRDKILGGGEGEGGDSAHQPPYELLSQNNLQIFS